MMAGDDAANNTGNTTIDGMGDRAGGASSGTDPMGSGAVVNGVVVWGVTCACGKGLRGLPVDGVCGGCGTEVMETLTRKGLAFASVDGKLARNLACVKCGYNMRGLAIDGACPECGGLVADSLLGNRLEFASSEYLRKLHVGAVWVVMSTVTLVGIVVLALAAQALGTYFVGYISAPVVQWVASGMGVVVNAMSFWGYWLLTTQDPGQSLNEQPRGARSVARVTVAVQACVQLAQLIIELSGGSTTVAPGNVVAMDLMLFIGIALQLVGMAMVALQFFAMMNYLRWLASRIPNPPMVKKTLRYRWLLPLLTTVGALACMMGPLIAMVMYWFLMNRFRGEMKAIRIRRGDLPMENGTNLVPDAAA